MNKVELMAQLDLSQSAYYKLLKNGLPSVRDERKEFDLNEVIKWIDNRNDKVIGKFVLGKEYSNKYISDVFSCASQGGMRRSLTYHALVIFTDHTGKSVYEDKWNKNILHYTGMGLTEDQGVHIAQNKTLANSTKNFVKVYLFETHEARKHTYSGQVELVDNPYTMSEKDSNGIERLVYKFPLKFIDEAASIDEEKMKKAEVKKRKQIKSLSSLELREKAETISNRNEAVNKRLEEEGDLFQNYRLIRKKEYSRDPTIAEYVKKIAEGICQLCDQPAPFKKNGVPFLHAHHIQYLSEGGLDTVDNSIAICPNCHAQIHELEFESDKKKLLSKVLERQTKNI